MTINERALQLFESNSYKEAFQLFKEAVAQKRDVQALNNLAWFYMHEEEDLVTAKELLQEVMTLKPTSYFPYNMLAEILMKEEQLEEAKVYLERSLQLQFSEQALHDLAICQFRLGAFQQAAESFAQVKNEGCARLNEAIAHIKAGNKEAAIGLLQRGAPEDMSYTLLEIADAYIEVEDFAEACQLFAQEWDAHIEAPYIVSRYAYTLWQLNEQDEGKRVIVQAIKSTDDSIQEVLQQEVGAYRSEAERLETVEEMQQQKAKLTALLPKLQAGYKPSFSYDFYEAGGCYLFGCQQHGHLAYRE